jgi:murein DD-endopeptidase MepM/ murein hydrolase activator NlpD
VAEGRDGPAETPATRLGDPTSLRATGAAERKPLARLMSSKDWRVVARAARPEKPNPAATHPVDGAADYGEVDAVFGAQRSSHVHEGQDVFAPAGTPLLAVRDGEVVEAGSDAGRGNHVSIYSKEADQTYVYFHLLSPAQVKTGERVSGGDRVGDLGCTGSCYGDHLHFEVHEGRGAETPAIDPLPLLRRWE